MGRSGEARKAEAARQSPVGTASTMSGAMKASDKVIRAVRALMFSRCEIVSISGMDPARISPSQCRALAMPFSSLFRDSARIGRVPVLSVGWITSRLRRNAWGDNGTTSGFVVATFGLANRISIA